MARHGQTAFANYQAYVGERAPNREVVRFVREQSGGAFSWDEVARFRERWRGPLVVKGILHPQDAGRAIALGVDGIVVSNHGGRQLESAAASIDALPAVVAAVGGRAVVLFDSGIRSGEDGSAMAIFECNVSSLRYEVIIPKATGTERKKVGDVLKKGGDAHCPRHGPGRRLVRAGKDLVCPECGVAYARP